MTSRSPYIACKGLNAFKNITHQSSKIFPTIILKVPFKSCVQFSACIESLGIESGTITDGQITASSELSSDHIASFARLNRVKEGHRGGSWSTKTNDVNQWLQWARQWVHQCHTDSNTRKKRFRSVGGNLQASIQRWWGELSILQGTRSNRRQGCVKL